MTRAQELIASAKLSGVQPHNIDLVAILDRLEQHSDSLLRSEQVARTIGNDKGAFAYKVMRLRFDAMVRTLFLAGTDADPTQPR